MAEAKAVTTATFQKDVLDVPGVSVVDFWAPWCGYCVRMMPIFEELEGGMSDKVNFAKVNTDEEIDLAKQYEIDVLPTFLVLKDGQVVDRKIGYMPLAELKAVIEAHL
ncbi:MAG: thioredoxin [Veillonellaceae bacterium]|nr:thioredoxin [Veillonellaceae bacterium]